jgi:hypothetical protein
MQIIHRHTFTHAEAAAALIGDALADCERLELRIDGDQIIVDVVEPVSPAVSMDAPAPSMDAKPRAEPAEALDESNQRKGGPISRKAAMLSGEAGFWKFVNVASKEEAADLIRQKCGIQSRADLDHDEQAAAIFRKMAGNYDLWLEGYDVEPGL